jgi:Sec-independent protein secretion pathway component TatC
VTRTLYSVITRGQEGKVPWILMAIAGVAPVLQLIGLLGAYVSVLPFINRFMVGTLKGGKGRAHCRRLP